MTAAHTTSENDARRIGRMKHRPILFKGPLVRAILDGKKTETRRLVRDGGFAVEEDPDRPWQGNWVHNISKPHPCEYACTDDAYSQCPYGGPGDRLYVRETWRPDSREYPAVFSQDGIHYRADDAFVPIENTVEAANSWVDLFKPGMIRSQLPSKWRPSIFMPRWVSRITLEVTGVHVERVTRITTDGVIAEGVEVPDVDYTVPDHPYALEHERDCYARSEFRRLWDEVNGKRGAFADDPWVWVVKFRLLEVRS